MAEETWSYIGVDRDGSEWIAVGYSDDHSIGAAVFETIDELWSDHRDHADRIVVDVPVGLCSSLDDSDPCGRKADGELSRHCDDLARTVIGSRFSSVFTAPCREAMEIAAKGAPYSEVNATNKDKTGKGLMQQAASIAPCIAEVDGLLQDVGIRKSSSKAIPKCVSGRSQTAISTTARRPPRGSTSGCRCSSRWTNTKTERGADWRVSSRLKAIVPVSTTC